MRHALRSQIVLLGLITTLALGPSANATSTLDVRAQEQLDGSLGLFVMAPQEARLSGDGNTAVEVTLDGRKIDSRVLEIQGAVSDERVLLLVDTSGSMQGARLQQVRQAVDELSDSLEPGVLLGLATFADAFRVLVPPSTDREKLEQALAEVRGEGDTALFGALLTIVDDDVAERVIVLTDGQDTASSVGARDVIRGLSTNPTPIDVIALDALGEPTDDLTRVIQASGGRAIVTPQDLAAPLQQAARGVRPVLRISTDTPWTQLLPGQEIGVSVTDANGSTFVGQTSVPTPALVTTQEQAGLAPFQPWTSYLLAVLAFVAVAVGTATTIALVRKRRSRTRIRQVLSHYETSAVRRSEGKSGEADQSGKAAPSPLTWLPRAWAEGTRRQVENAGLPFTPVAWLVLQACVMIAAFGLLLLVGLPGIVALLGLVLSGVLMQAIVRARIESSRRRFDSELADFFTLVASGLRSGLSLAQAVSGAAQSGSDVLAKQMRRVTTEVSLGMDLADALDGVAHRMASQDLAFAVQAVRIQREAGGSLSSILDIAATGVRQRAQLQREVRALSAEGRISAVILMVLPVAVFAFFFVTRRDYVEVFWTEPAGWVMLIGLVLILSIGAIWMQRMTKIDV